MDRMLAWAVAMRRRFYTADVFTEHLFGGNPLAVIPDGRGIADARMQQWSAGEGTPLERLRGLIAAMVENYRADPYGPRLITEQVLFADDDDFARGFVDQFGHSHIAALREVLDAGRDRGEFRDIDVDAVIPAITGAATAICNVGPAMGPIIGPNGTFAPLPDSAKWMLSAGMLFGRLEIFTVLVLFLPSFWRN